MANDRTSRRVHLGAVLCLAMLAVTVQAGPLEPPGPPGEPTMLPIDRVDPRIPIHPDIFPVIITEPGSYYLTGNVSTTGNGIIIEADNVTIDLMGFTLEGGTGLGIDGSQHQRVTVRNGTVQYWSDTGVRLDSNAVVQDLSVISNGGSGISVGIDGRVIGCTAERNTIHGIIALTGSLVKDSLASNNTENGVWISSSGAGGFVTGCVVDNNRRNGIRADGMVSVLGNHVRGNDIGGTNGKAGIWLFGWHNRAEGNTVLGNNIGINIDGDHNVVVRNIVGRSLVRNFDEDVAATGNYVPVWATGTTGAPDPWANIEQP